MKKGRLYNRQEIELISKSAIGKSVNDILNEEVITISNKSNKKSLIATYGNHPNLCFIGHSDTVRCSNNWRTVPHKLTRYITS